MCCLLTSEYLIDALIFLPNDFISFAGYIQYITMITVKHQAAQALLPNFLYSSLAVFIAHVFYCMLQSCGQCKIKIMCGYLGNHLF